MQAPEIEKVGPGCYRFAGFDTGVRIGFDVAQPTLRDRFMRRFFPKAWEAAMDEQFRRTLEDAFGTPLGKGWMRVTFQQEGVGVTVERIPPEEVYRHG